MWLVRTNIYHTTHMYLNTRIRASNLTCHHTCSLLDEKERDATEIKADGCRSNTTATHACLNKVCLCCFLIYWFWKKISNHCNASCVNIAITLMDSILALSITYMYAPKHVLERVGASRIGRCWLAQISMLWSTNSTVCGEKHHFWEWGLYL